MIKDKTVIGFTEVRGDTEGGYGFRRPFLPFPEPAGVQVGVTDKM